MLRWDYVRGIPSFKTRNRMPPMNSLDDYLPWADSTATISRLDRTSCIFFVNLHRKYS